MLYSSARFSRADTLWSASSISCRDDRGCGAPFTSPTSTVSTVLRSGTSGSRKLSRKATNEIGTATRNTVCTECVTASMYFVKKASPTAVDLSLASTAGSSVCGLKFLRRVAGTLASVGAMVWLKVMA